MTASKVDGWPTEWHRRHLGHKKKHKTNIKKVSFSGEMADLTCFRTNLERTNNPEAQIGGGNISLLVTASDLQKSKRPSF